MARMTRRRLLPSALPSLMDEVVNNSLKQLENDLAEYITAAIAALRIRGGMGGMTNETWAKITDLSTLKTWVAIASTASPRSCTLAAANRRCGWIERRCKRSHGVASPQGDSTMSRGGGHEKEMKSLTCSFDSFIHRIPDYRNTSVELTELLECLVEAVVAEMLASVLVHVEVGKNEVPMDVIDAIAVYAVNALMRTEAVPRRSRRVAFPPRIQSLGGCDFLHHTPGLSKSMPCF